jgi:hypothetical protein
MRIVFCVRDRLRDAQLICATLQSQFCRKVTAPAQSSGQIRFQHQFGSSEVKRSLLPFRRIMEQKFLIPEEIFLG